MNDINFLPASYLRRRRQIRRVRLEWACIVLAAFALLCATFGIRHSDAVDRRRVHELEAKRAEARMMIDAVASLELLEKQLHQQCMLQRDLVQPITQTQVLATISQMLPASLAMTELRVSVQRSSPENYRVPVSTSGAAKGSRQAAPPPPPPPQYITLTFNGVAAKELDLADLVGALSEHPVFANVKLHYSREIDFLRMRGRDFRMSVQVPLNCQIVPPRQEVANVD